MRGGGHFLPGHPHHHFIRDLLATRPLAKGLDLLALYAQHHWHPCAPLSATPFVTIAKATLLDGLPCQFITQLCALEPDRTRLSECALAASFALLDLADSAPCDRYRVQCRLVEAFDALWSGPWRARLRTSHALASRVCRWPALRLGALFARMPLRARDYWALLYEEADINHLLTLLEGGPPIEDTALRRELAYALVQRLTDIGRRLPKARPEPYGHNLQLVLVRLGASYDTELALFQPLRDTIEAWMQAAKERRWYPRGNMQFITSLTFAYKNAAYKEQHGRRRITLLVLRRLAQRHGLPLEVLVTHVFAQLPPIKHDARLVDTVQRLALRFY